MILANLLNIFNPRTTVPETMEPVDPSKYQARVHADFQRMYNRTLGADGTLTETFSPESVCGRSGSGPQAAMDDAATELVRRVLTSAGFVTRVPRPGTDWTLDFAKSADISARRVSDDGAENVRYEVSMTNPRNKRSARGTVEFAGRKLARGGWADFAPTRLELKDLKQVFEWRGQSNPGVPTSVEWATAESTKDYRRAYTSAMEAEMRSRGLIGPNHRL